MKFDELRTYKIEVRFAHNSTNIRRIELVRKFDRSLTEVILFPTLERGAVWTPGSRFGLLRYSREELIRCQKREQEHG